MKYDAKGTAYAAILCLCGFALCGPCLLSASNNEQSSEQGQAGTPSESFEQLVMRAQAAMAANRIPEAIQLYESATKLRPTWSEGWWYLGTMFFDAARYPEAHDAFVHFVSVEQREPGPGYGMLGLTEFHLKNYRAALRTLEHGRELGLGTNQDFVNSVLYYDGILNNLLGQPEIALQRFTLAANEIASQHPDIPEEAVLSDSALLDAFGMAALRIPKLPSEIPSAKSSLIHKAGHAQALVALQDRVKAEAEMKQLIAQYPSEPGVHYMYGVFLLKEHPPLAMSEFRREAEIAPSSYPAKIQLAFALLGDAKYQEGLVYADQAVALAPKNFVAHVVRGRLLLEMGKTNRAVDELRVAVKLAPGSPDAHFALAQALAQAGRNAEATRERATFERLKAQVQAADRNK